MDDIIWNDCPYTDQRADKCTDPHPTPEHVTWHLNEQARVGLVEKVGDTGNWRLTKKGKEYYGK
jgi:hypothetical protein